MLPIRDAVNNTIIPTVGHISERSARLAAFALTGFANFSSVGIQLGGIGGMAPGRRHDLARLGMRALFVGFTATLLNASIAGILLPSVIEPAQPAAAAPTVDQNSKPVPETPAGKSTEEKVESQSTEPAKPADKSSLYRFHEEIEGSDRQHFAVVYIDRTAVSKFYDFASSSFFARERYRHPTM